MFGIFQRMHALENRVKVLEFKNDNPPHYKMGEMISRNGSADAKEWIITRMEPEQDNKINFITK